MDFVHFHYKHSGNSFPGFYKGEEEVNYDYIESLDKDRREYIPSLFYESIPSFFQIHNLEISKTFFPDSIQGKNLLELAMKWGLLFGMVNWSQEQNTETNVFELTDENYKNTKVGILFPTNLGFCLWRSDLHLPLHELEYHLYISPKKYYLISTLYEIDVSINKRSPFCKFEIDINQPQLLCDFLFNGKWEPKWYNDTFSYFLNTMYKKPLFSTDFLSFTDKESSEKNFKELRFMFNTKIVTGIIGKISDINNLLQISGNQHEVLNKITNPVILGMGLKNIPERFLLIYIVPNNISPMDPLFSPATEYALAFFKRACLSTLILPEEKEVESSYLNRIPGILPNLSGFDDYSVYGSGVSTCFVRKKFVPKQINFFQTIYEADDYINWISTKQFKNIPTNNGKRYIDPVVFNIFSYIRKNQGNSHPMNSILFSYKSVEDELQCIINEYNSKGLHIWIERAIELTKRAVNIVSSKKDTNHCDICCSTNEIEPESMFSALENAKQMCIGCRLLFLSKKKPESSEEIRNMKDLLKKKAEGQKIYNDSFISFTRLLQNGRDFVLWFFQYWVKMIYHIYWEELKKANHLKIPESKFINRPNDNFADISDVSQFIIDLFEKEIKEEIVYLEILSRLVLVKPIELDFECVYNAFEHYNEMSIIQKRKGRVPLDYLTYQKKCQLLIDSLQKGKGIIDRFEIDEFYLDNENKYCLVMNSKINVCNDLLFYNITNNNSSIDRNPSLFGNSRAKLCCQPEFIIIQNAFVVPNGVLIVSFNGLIWVVLYLENGFCGYSPQIIHTFVDNQTDVMSSFSSNLMTLNFLYKQNNSTILSSYMFMNDHKCLNLVAERSLDCLNMYFHPFKPTFNGIITDTFRNNGIVLCNIMNDNNSLPHIIKFNIVTLELLRITNNILIDKGIIPFGLTYYKEKEVLYLKTNPQQQKASIYIVVDGKPLCKEIGISTSLRIGTVSINGTDVVFYGNGLATHVLTSDDYSNNPFIPSYKYYEPDYSSSFSYENVNCLITNNLERFGLSEIERICLPTKSFYPIESAQVDVILRSTQLHMSLLDSLNETLGKVSQDGILFPIRIDFMPVNSNVFDTMFERSKDIPIPYNFPSLLIRFFNLPKTWFSRIKGNRSKEFINNNERQFFYKSLFPVFPYARLLQNCPSSSITIVDLDYSNSSQIISHLSGLPFLNQDSGSFTIGNVTLPIIVSNDSFIDNKTNTIDSSSVTNYANVFFSHISLTFNENIFSSIIDSLLMMSQVIIINFGDDIERIFCLINSINQVVYNNEINGKTIVFIIDGNDTFLSHIRNTYNQVNPNNGIVFEFISSRTSVYHSSKSIADKCLGSVISSIKENDCCSTTSVLERIMTYGSKIGCDLE